ncbi:hypothetical protein DFH11DRAFT_138193 [Phellopilus nigrolimitatus]|nr:hypothetical protein DFH11DRAFT_138193 [Phellopilus nigrolimitatus]
MSHDTIADVTEIVRFSEFKSNEAEAEAFALVKKLDGCLRSYHGPQSGESSSGVWVHEWQTLADHTAFQKSTIYPSFIAGVGDFAKIDSLVHVQLKPYPAARAFGAPLTELTVATLKPTTTAAQFEAALAEAAGSFPQIGASARGVVLENDRQYVLVNGWDSAEARRQALATSAVQEISKKIGELADFQVGQYTFVQ